MAKRQIVPAVLFILWALCLAFIWLWDPETPDPIPNPDPPALGMAFSPPDPDRTELAEPASRSEIRADLTAGPIDDVLDYAKAVATYEPPAPETQTPVPTSEPTSNSDQPVVSGSGSSGLPYLLQKIRSCESGPWRDGTCGYDLSLYSYTAYNATGCEGAGCGGAYQMHASYAAGWAAEAGYPGMSSQAQTWPPAIQDAVALYKFNATGGGLWCDWASYC